MNFNTLLTLRPVNKDASMTVQQAGVSDSFLRDPIELDREYKVVCRELALLANKLHLAKWRTKGPLRDAINSGRLKHTEPDVVLFYNLFERRSKLQRTVKELVGVEKWQGYGDVKPGDTVTIHTKEGALLRTETVLRLSVAHFFTTGEGDKRGSYSRRNGKGNKTDARKAIK